MSNQLRLNAIGRGRWRHAGGRAGDGWLVNGPPHASGPSNSEADLINFSTVLRTGLMAV
jgi:hypothetical protein